MHALVLLDRSGSMHHGWKETLGALNLYATKLKPKTKITLAVFDGGHEIQFDVIRERVKAKEWVPVSTEEVSPRGGTPLLDAIGKLNGLVTGLGKRRKMAITILTDGGENQSRKLTKEGAGAIIAEWKDKGYDVVFIGADFDAFGEAGSLGIDRRQTLNVSKAKMGETFSAMASRSNIYADTGAVAAFTDKERADTA